MSDDGEPASDVRIDCVFGTRAGLLWVLPAFAVVVGGVVAAVPRFDPPWLGGFWGLAAGIALASFGWALTERQRARRFGRWLLEHRADVLGRGAPFDGRHVTGLTTVVQHEVRVAVLVLDVGFKTSPRELASPLLPTLVAGVFGWWSLPWGPIANVRVIVSNLRGGHRRDVAELLEALMAPATPRAAWYRRLLALDTGSPVQIVANGAIALVLLALAVGIALAIVSSRLAPR